MNLMKHIPDEISYFKECSVSGYITFNEDLEPIKSIISETTDIKILSSKLIKNDSLVSNEGQILTGFSLLVNYSININIKYISNKTYNNMFFLSYLDFANYCYIVLPQYINDLHIESIVSRNLYSLSNYLENLELEVTNDKNIFYHISNIFNFIPLL